MPRVKLHNRRRTLREKVYFAPDDQTFFLDIGLDAWNCPREIFMRPDSRSGSMLERLYDDIGVLLSLLLQHGYTAADLLPRLGKLGGAPGDKTPPRLASPIGAALKVAAEIDEQSAKDAKHASSGRKLSDSDGAVDE